MPCGERQIIPVYPEIRTDVVNGSFYVQFECDVAEPDHVKKYFAEMGPIFKNTEIQYKYLGPERDKGTGGCLHQNRSSGPCLAL
jgi:hypothetical protein